MNRPALAQEDSEDLAKKLVEPRGGPHQRAVPGKLQWRHWPLGRWQQVYVISSGPFPFTLTRTGTDFAHHCAITWQDDIFPGAGTQFGLGNTTQSFFFHRPTGEWFFVWGVGPVLYLPTNTMIFWVPTMGSGADGSGAVQTGGWTLGILANQIWSFAGDHNVPDINSTLFSALHFLHHEGCLDFTLNTGVDL